MTDLPMIVRRNPLGYSPLSMDNVRMVPRPAVMCGRYTLAEIMWSVSQAAGVPILHMKSHSRSNEYVRARMVFYVIARDVTGTSYPGIGRACGGRDHSTVMHGIASLAERRAEFEPVIQAALAILRQRKIDEAWQ